MSPATADLAALAGDIAAAEAAVPGLRPGCEKRIIWADAAPRQTPWSVVYLHGFSATGEELRPLPDLVARRFAANLYFDRLTGHGQDGAALDAATCADWQADVAAALRIGARLGERVIVMACSTGAPLAAIEIARGAQVDALLCVSPNFGLRHVAARAMTATPALDGLYRILLQSEQVLTHNHPGHAAYFTTRYPRTAVHAVAETVRAFQALDLSRITTPAFLAVNPDDKVINPAAAVRAAQDWGGPVHQHRLIQTPADDRNGHVMAGSIFSPNQTGPLAAAMSDWLAAL